MHVFRSNRLDVLVDELVKIIALPLESPFQAECIVVQSRGMERWLSMQLASRMGIAAHIEYSFVRKLIEQLLQPYVKDESQKPFFEAETLLFTIAALLHEFIERPSFSPLRAYLSDDPHLNVNTHWPKRIQLAKRIAFLFDHYHIFRPAMLREWENGEGDDWQAELWRGVVKRSGVSTIAKQGLALGENLASFSSAWPKRISFFGLSTLPPFFLDILQTLSRRIEIYFYILSPCREYWADIQSKKRIAKAAQKRGLSVEYGEKELHLTEGNPLLASLGKVGRDFFELLLERNVEDEPALDLFLDPGTSTMLHTLQSDILNLYHRKAGSSRTFPLALCKGDHSICLHSCHSPRREVEVLHDRLTALLEEDSTLAPHDIVVMTPDIEAYAPFVEAVFKSSSENRPVLPFHIADRAPRTTFEIVEAFLSVTACLEGRLTSKEVLDLLSYEAIRQRFGLIYEDLHLLKTWVHEAGIRWGVDGDHRLSVGQPGYEENTWRFGLKRLLLGYAGCGKDFERFKDTLPYADLDPSRAAVLGHFTDFCETVFTYADSIKLSRSVPQWRDYLCGLLLAFFDSQGDLGQEHQTIFNTLTDLAAKAQTAGFEDELGLDAFLPLLTQSMQRKSPGHVFLSGGILFCEMVPMRAIPFRVVCLLGMNADAFPRHQQRPSFDKLIQHPQLGDRSLRDDDRYLFLEAILSARERLIITFVGQSAEDNTSQPPSVVVDELLDVISESFFLPLQDPVSGNKAQAGASPVAIRETRPKTPSPIHDKNADTPTAVRETRPQTPSPIHDKNADTPTAVRERLLIKHPLHPFNPRYFDGKEPNTYFSFAKQECPSASALAHPPQTQQLFFERPLAPDETIKVVTVNELVAFLKNPVRALLQKRLGLYFGSNETELSEREPMNLDALSRWRVNDAILTGRIRQIPLPEIYAGIKANGVLPLGTAGACVFEMLEPLSQAVFQAAWPLLQEEPLDPLDVDLQLDGIELVGVLRHICRKGMVRHQISQVGTHHELAFWINHLLLNHSAPPGYPRDSYLIGTTPKKDATLIHFLPVTDSASVLKDFLRIYSIGLRLPLPFFPTTSRTYAETLYKNSDAEKALSKAYSIFQNPYLASQENQDPYVCLAFDQQDILDPAFQPLGFGEIHQETFASLAQAVFFPLLAHRQEEA